VIAIECRALNLSEAETEKVLRKWASTLGSSQHDATRPIRNAFMKTAGGKWKYHAPGVHKKPGTLAHEILGPTCELVGCPANCPAYRGVHVGPQGEDFRRFEELRWPEHLRRARYAAAVDIYRTVCDLERERGFAAGAPIIASTKQIAERAGRARQHVPGNLQTLYSVGLFSMFAPGGGSGPHARDRVATTVARAVPIPQPSDRLLAQLTTEHDPVPQIEHPPCPKEIENTPAAIHRAPEADGDLVDLAERIAARERPRERRRRAGG
jgi:hypothetical protein